MAAIHELSAVELAASYEGGELSPVEATKALLAHLDAWEPRLNAMYLIHREAALRQARDAEKRWHVQAPLSPLDGIPVTVKENIFTKGDPAPLGAACNLPAAPQPADAPPAARLRQAGCVLLGKTTMPDFGMLSSGLSSVHGVTRNPWNTAKNPSGSSSGAAAACAAGYAPLHLGTDIGGSVRLPATHCGIFGLKPSHGRVPVYPPYLGRVAGPMTRDVETAALMLNWLSLPDPRDFMSLPHRSADYTAGLDQIDLKRVRIGLLPDLRVGLPVHPEVRAAVEAAAKALAGAGATVEPLDSFLKTEMLEGMVRFFEARQYSDFSLLPPERRHKVLPFVAEWATWRAKDFSGRDVMQAYGQIMAMREAAVAACEPFDFVISPASPILPYDAELPSPNDDPHDALPHIAFTVPFNMSGQPAASVNWTYSADGLPIGVQVIGRRFDDAGVLQLARALETLRPAQKPWPSLA